MKKYLLAIAVLLFSTKVEAGLISRTYTYTDGNTITANENNTNENTLYNEINGNISTANILDGTILNGDVADTQFTRAKMASALQSTFTYVDSLGAYRRPVMSFISVTTVDIEANTGTSNETCVHFADERRCVTENTASTSVNRRFIITENASQSGTKNSGLRTGYVEAANTWYALYAAKDDSTAYVVVGDTLTPVQANFSALNTAYGTNAWVYLGMVRNGDNVAAPSDLLAFTQVGNFIRFHNNIALLNTIAGLNLSSAAAATATIYTYTAGIGARQIPSHLGLVIYGGNSNGAASNATALLDSAANETYVKADNANSSFAGWFTGTASRGVRISNSTGAGVVQGVVLGAYWDGALGIGYNPQL